MATDTQVRTTLEVINTSECVARLAAHHLGRLAVVLSERPLIFPVTYAYENNAILFRADLGTKLSATQNQRVAFEIDGADGDTAWSVLVVGTAEVVEEPVDVSRVADLGLGAWNPGLKQQWVQIRGVVSGRRVVSRCGPPT
jgi:uncharacterized protein